SVHAIPRGDPAGDDPGPDGEAETVRFASRSPAGRTGQLLQTSGPCGSSGSAHAAFAGATSIGNRTGHALRVRVPRPLPLRARAAGDPPRRAPPAADPDQHRTLGAQLHPPPDVLVGAVLGGETRARGGGVPPGQPPRPALQ
ncbi:unnamed protein product, partial [Ectocarpus sp. 13 AM-2016]